MVRRVPVFLLVLAAPLAMAVQDVPDRPPVEMAQLLIHERIIIRVPRMSPAPTMYRALPRPVVRWKERKGPKCLAVADLAGALITKPASVDLVLNGGRRLRARLDRACRPLDFYAGFYLHPAPDGKVCAGRDTIHVRSGASCEIRDIKVLEPQH